MQDGRFPFRKSCTQKNISIITCRKIKTAQKIFDEKLSVRDTEKLVKKLQKEKKEKKDFRSV